MRRFSTLRVARFHVKEVADVVYEFRVTDGRAIELHQLDPSGEFTFTRKPSEQ
jgi:hypothetical protein